MRKFIIRWAIKRQINKLLSNPEKFKGVSFFTCNELVSGTLVIRILLQFDTYKWLVQQGRLFCNEHELENSFNFITLNTIDYVLDNGLDEERHQLKIQEYRCELRTKWLNFLLNKLQDI